MKAILNYRVILPIIFLLTQLGCNDAKYDIIKNSVYIAESEKTESSKVVVDETGGEALISIRLAQREDTDIKATLVENPKALEVYNQKYGTNYILLPKEFYTLSSDIAVIPAGSIGATPITLSIKPLSKELTDAGLVYAVPLEIENVLGDVEKLTSSSTTIVLLDQVIITSYPTFKAGKNRTFLNFKEPYFDLKEWSIEMRIKANKLGTGVGELANQAIFAWGDWSGSADPTQSEIYIRFGDAPIAGNILQIKSQGSQLNATKVFEPEVWYHLAFVCNGSDISIFIDGELDSKFTIPGKTYHLTYDACNIASCAGIDVSYSEIRIWKKAISQSQIKNNEFVINPLSDGLEGYWKMNEGSGNEFKDYTGHENHSLPGNGPSIPWTHNYKPNQ